MNLRRILAMMRKEVIQIWRDPRSLLIIFAMPLVQLVIYGYGVNLDIKHIPLCVYDRDATQTSQDLLKHFQATDYFTIVACRGKLSRRRPAALTEGACTVAVVVPPQFSEELHSSGQAQRASAARRQRQQHRQHRHGLRAEHRASLLPRRADRMAAAPRPAADNPQRHLPAAHVVQ